MATQRKRYAGRLFRQPYMMAMKLMILLASLFALAPLVQADTVVVSHDRNVEVHPEHYHHHYYHRHHVVVVEHN
jgi:hypothetical protein